MSNPVTDFYEWLSGAGAVRDAGGQMQAGADQASQTIQAAGNKALQFLNPYLQGGQQDYGNYRDKVNSGYYNQPMPGSYQPPQAPQRQAYNPTFNPQTQSYGQQQAPWQAPQAGTMQMQGLPQWTPRPAPQAPQVQPQGGQTGVVPTLQDLMKIVLKQNPAPMMQSQMTPYQVPQAPGIQTNPYSSPGGSKPWAENNQNTFLKLMDQIKMNNRDKWGPPMGGR